MATDWFHCNAEQGVERCMWDDMKTIAIAMTLLATAVWVNVDEFP